MTIDPMGLPEHIWIVPITSDKGYATAFFCSGCKVVQQYSKQDLINQAWLKEHGKHVPALAG